MKSNKEILKEHSLKFSKQRDLLLTIFNEHKRPLTAEDVYNMLDSAMDLSTVYRIINVFTVSEILLKLSMQNESKALYLLNENRHVHHLVCLSCHQVKTIEGCPIHHYEHELKKKTDYDIVSHNLEIFGYCPECKEK